MQTGIHQTNSLNPSNIDSIIQGNTIRFLLAESSLAQYPSFAYLTKVKTLLLQIHTQGDNFTECSL